MDIIKNPKFISSLSCLLAFCAIGLLSYLPAALKYEVTHNIFTISQGLAYSIKSGFIIVFTVSILLFGYLMYYKSKKYIFIRLFLLLIIYSFIVTILWVTTYYNTTEHYIFAALIFTAVLLLININNYIIYKSNNNILLHKGLISISVITVLIFVAIFSIVIVMNKENIDFPIIFPSLENSMLLMQGISIILVGFS